MFNEKMQPCWIFALMLMVMVMALMTVVIKADISTTPQTKRPLKKLDRNCLQNLGESEMKICATNGTDFVSFPNECRLREANRNKGITAFKKVTFASCASSTSANNSTNNRPIVEAMGIQSKLSNKQRATILPSTLSAAYNATPTTNQSKNINKFVSATTWATLKTVDNIAATTISTISTTTTRPKIYNKQILTSISPNIATNPQVLPIDKFMTSTTLSIAKPENSATPVNEVTSTTIRPKIYNKQTLAPISTVIPIDEFITKHGTVVTSTSIRPVNEIEPHNILLKNVYKKEASSIVPNTKTNYDIIIGIPSSTIRPILNEVEPNSLLYKKEASSIVPNTKTNYDIIIGIPSSTIRPILNEVEPNSLFKTTTVNKDPKVNPITPETSINVSQMNAKMETQKTISCPYIFDPVCATYDGVHATFINECLLNAENVKTGKDWRVYKMGICNKHEVEHTNQQQQQKVSAEKDNYANSPTELELADDNIVYAPIIERTDYEDGPIVEHTNPSHEIPRLTNLIASNKQFYPSYDAPATLNYWPNNENFYPPNKAPLMANSMQENEPFYPSYRAPAMANFEYSRYSNPLSESDFISPIAFGASSPIPYTISDNVIGKQSIRKRQARHSNQRKYLPCTKTFNPVCAIFSGVKSTFINECLVNAENIKTGTAWTVFSSGVCAEDYASSLNENNLGTISTRSYIEKSYKADQLEPVKEVQDPNIIYIAPIFQTEFIEDPNTAQNYYPFSEEQILTKSNIYSTFMPGNINFEPAKEYATSLSEEINFDSSYNYNEPIPEEPFETSKEYTAPFLATNSYSPLFHEDNKLEGTTQYAPFGTLLPNLQFSAQYEPLPSRVDSTNYLQPFESANAYAPFFPYATNSESLNKYGPLSSVEEIDPPCRPSAEKKPITVVDENLPIDKVSSCSFGAAQLPVCAIYKNERRSFDTICELMLRNTLRNETWAPLYDGRCKCPEVCTLGIEPICVSRNGIKETIPNLCFYERLKIQDPLSSWQYLYQGECFLSPLDSAFRHLTKPADPFTIKVPDYENTNLPISHSRKLVNPLTFNDNYQEISSPVLKNPSDFRGYREIKKSNNGVFENKLTPTSKTTSKEYNPRKITTSSSSTTAPVLTSTLSNPNYSTTTAQPYDQTTTVNDAAATEAKGKIIPYKRPITRFVVSAKRPNRASIYSANPNSVIMRLAKRRAFNAANSKSPRSSRKNAGS